MVYLNCRGDLSWANPVKQMLAFTLWNPEMIVQTIDAIEQGLQMGKNAKPLFAIKWEENWQKSISQWRTELNVQPVSRHCS